MKNTKAVLAIAFVIVFGAYSYWVKGNVRDDKSLGYSKGDQFQSFTLPTIENSPVDVRSIIEENKLTWVNFWATWCGPCRREMPMMADLYNNYKGKGLGIVAISIGEQPQTVHDYLHDYPVPFPVLVDPNRTQSEPINIQVLPTSFLVDSTGKIIQKGVGLQESWGYLIKSRLDNE